MSLRENLFLFFLLKLSSLPGEQTQTFKDQQFLDFFQNQGKYPAAVIYHSIFYYYAAVKLYLKCINSSVSHLPLCWQLERWSVSVSSLVYMHTACSRPTSWKQDPALEQTVTLQVQPLPTPHWTGWATSLHPSPQQQTGACAPTKEHSQAQSWTVRTSPVSHSKPNHWCQGATVCDKVLVLSPESLNMLKHKTSTTERQWFQWAVSQIKRSQAIFHLRGYSGWC